MAEPRNPLTLGQFGTLREGLLSTANKSARPLSKFGVDFAITPQDAVLGSLPAVGGLYNIANALNQARVNQIARSQVGQEPLSFFQEVSKGDFSATQQLQDKIKDQYGAVNRETIQDYFMKNNPELDLAPIEFTQKNVDLINRNAQRDVFKAGTQPFKSGKALKQSGFRGDYTKQSQEPYIEDDPRFGGKMSFEDAFLAGRFDDDLKSPEQFAEDKYISSNIRDFKPSDPNKRGGFDPAFSRAVTLQSQAGNVEQEAPTQETFICSVLYNQGLLPRKIYACDVIYGKGINFYTYKGYEVWGKWFAKKLKNNKMLFKIFYPVFVQWANQMAFEVSGGKYGKNNTFIKILKRTGETISNIIGRIAERRKRWSTQ